MKEKLQHKVPKTLGACADRLYELRNKRLVLQKEAESIEEEEKALKLHIINNLPKSDASGISGKLCRVSINVKEVPQVKDWDVLYKHIIKTKSFELLQRRLSDVAVKERWNDEKEVPGVEHFSVVTVAMNKL